MTSGTRPSPTEHGHAHRLAQCLAAWLTTEPKPCEHLGTVVLITATVRGEPAAGCRCTAAELMATHADPLSCHPDS
jgi:hypothetical protein